MKTIFKSIALVGLLGLLFGCTRQSVVEPANSTDATLTGGRLDITDFTIAGQLGKTLIDFDNSQVYVYVPYNANLANLMVTKAWASSQGSIMYMGNPLAEGMNYNFTTPLNVQVVKGDSQKNWTIRVILFMIDAFDAGSGTFNYENVDYVNKRIDFDYVTYFLGSGSPRSIEVRFDLPFGMTIPINRQLVDLTKPLKFTMTAPNGYSEEWTLYSEQVVVLFDKDTPYPSVVDYVGWDFNKMEYVPNYPANQKDADLAAFIDGNIYGVAGGCDFVLFNPLNSTKYVYYGDGMAAQTFYYTATKAAALTHFDAKVAVGKSYPYLVGKPLEGQVYVVKVPNGDYFLLRIASSSFYGGPGKFNFFYFSYRKLE